MKKLETSPKPLFKFRTEEHLLQSENFSLHLQELYP